MKYSKVQGGKGNSEAWGKKYRVLNSLVSSLTLSLNTDMHTCSKMVKRQSFAKLESKYNFFPLNFRQQDILGFLFVFV